MGVWTGTVPTFAAGAKLRGVDQQTLADIASALTDSWTTWVPTLTNLTQGSGTLTAKYRRVGKTVDFRFLFIFGAASAVGTSPQFTLPVAPHSDYAAAAGAFLGSGYLIDASGGARDGAPLYVSGSTVTIQFWNATPANTGVTSTGPWTWATGDILEVHGTYYTA